jgi:SsrA-binding protein
MEPVLLTENRKAHFQYAILSRYRAGIALLGTEVKSIKAKRGNLSGSYVVIRDNQPLLLNMDIPPYQGGNTPESYNPTRTRKLLLEQKEIHELMGKLKEKGVSLIPLALWNVRGLIKVELGLARGRQAKDTREVLKARGARREMREV